MKKNNSRSFLIFLLCMTGCTENQMEGYINDPAIYFNSSYDRARVDISHSFFLLNGSITQDTVWVRVNAMGKTEPTNRPISIVQTNTGEPDAAVPGLHYLSLDGPGIKEVMVIPANAANTRIPVVFLRHSSMDLQTVRLELTVAQNEYFRPGIDKQRYYVITSTNMAEKPSNWDTVWRTFFGASWGTVKFRFIIDATGYTEWGTGPDYLFGQYLRDQVAQKFAEYNRDNPNDPLIEADGTLVAFL